MEKVAIQKRKELKNRIRILITQDKSELRRSPFIKSKVAKYQYWLNS